MQLAPPYDILDLRDGGRLVTRVTRVEEGEVAIVVRRTGEQKTVTAVRLYVPVTDKPTVPYYWDVTSTRAAAGLRGLLPSLVGTGKWLTILKRGIAPTARFELGVLQPGDNAAAIAETAT